MTVHSDLPSSTQAARLVLLNLRAGLPKRAHLSGFKYRLGPDQPVLAADDAALVLTQMPKPLVCAATSQDGILDVRCGPLTDPEPSGLYEHRRQTGRFGGFIGPMLNERYGPEIDHLRVMWVGRDERLAISVEEMSEFYRDYVCWPDATGAGDWIDSQYAQHRGITRENAQGAVAIVICFPRQLPGSRRLRLLAWLRPLRRLGALFTRVVSRFLFRRVILRGAANRVGRTFLSPMNYREGGRVVDHLLATARATREPRVRIDILNGVIDPPALRTAMLEEAVTPLRAMLEDEVESWDRAIGGVSVSSACMTIDFELDKIHHEPLIPGDLPVYRCVVEIVDKRGKLHRTQVREFWRS